MSLSPATTSDMIRFSITEKHFNIFLSAIFIVGFSMIICIFIDNFGLQESGYNFLGKTKKITLDVNRPVTQTFLAKKDGLNQVRVTIGNSNIQKNERILFELKDASCAYMIASETLDTRTTDLNNYYPFKFPAIQDSLGKMYCFKATFYSDTDRRGDKPYFSATQDPDPIFSDRIITDANKEKSYPSQTIFLRPAYTTGSIASDIDIFTNRFSPQYKPWFFKSGWLIAISAAFLLSTLALFWYLIKLRN